MGATYQVHLGAPAVDAIPGGQVVVVYIDRRDNYVRACVFERNKLSSATDDRMSELPVPRDPTAIAYQHPGCFQDGRHTSSDTFGRVGSDVTAVTFEFAHGKPVQGGVLRGFYAASWPSHSYPDRITLTTKSGGMATVNVPHSLSTGRCFNVTGLADIGK